MTTEPDRLAIPGYDEVWRLECADALAFVSLHAVIQGRSFGGVRIREYASENDALADALALSRAMSRKVALAGIAGGGGKSVLMVPRKDRAEAVKRLGEFVESLGGRYFCGPDYGFTEADGAVMRGVTRFIAQEDLSDATARGVEAAMRAACEPRVVVVQGLGAVGMPLAERLRASGVRVIASDVRAFEGFERVDPDDVYDLPCDVFAPCAIGGVLDSRTIPRLRCGVVCGAANNPLASEDDAERLRLRGVTYVPDIIANVGATVQGASTAIGEFHLIEGRLAAIGQIVRDVLARASREARSPHHVAVSLADERIEALRKHGATR
ncbi:MAG: Glu/Leu/Phe/Val dehydrogenase dimerization domain-containing protein [Planctomycetota bacterium]